jgi:putative protease
MNKNKVELLAPAGNLSRLKIALLYGADACYIGGKNYSLRANANNFSLDEIREACSYAHNLSKKIYVTVNIVFHNEDIQGLKEYLMELAKAKVDAIISSDPSIIDIIKENNIPLDIHISTQISTLNYEQALFWKNLGIPRIVLGREASSTEIKEIIEKTGMEVEMFIHGAMCSSYSGRCVLSNYFTNRDANRGGCAQICRWEFDLADKDRKIINRPTKFTMSTKDLSLITNLNDILDLGVASLKIEGRMRSDYYIATVVKTYREAIDDYYNNSLTKERINYYEKILSRVANRDNTTQFFNGLPGVEGQYYLGRQELSNQDFLGVVLDYNVNTKMVTIKQKNYFKKGDIVEFFGPNIKTFTYTIKDIYDEENNLIEIINHPEQIVKFKVENKLYPQDIMRIEI